MSEFPLIRWTVGDEEHSARWRSEAGVPPPKRVVFVDDTLNGDSAFRLACEGTAMLWQGDFQNARQLLMALARRADRKPAKKGSELRRPLVEFFHLHRQAQAQRSRILGMLLVPLDADYGIPLRRAPDLKLACGEVFGPGNASADPTGVDSVISLRELLSLVSAHEWRKKGVEIPVLGARIHPYYGVFSPVRGEYLDLVAAAPLPKAMSMANKAFDIGTGTGVLAALLAKRGVMRITATDQDPRALACARENVERLGLGKQIKVVEANLFPDGKAPLIVCNPPWIPARPSSPIECAVYDPDSQMLRGFLNGLKEHLGDGGEGWLILSDLAEHLGLRTRAELTAMFDAAGLAVLGKSDIRPRHGKALDIEDPLHTARVAEVTSLWRLAVA